MATNTFRLWAISILGVFILVACGGGDTSTNTGDSGVPDDFNDSVVQWDRDPLSVVFRADVVGGDDRDSIWRKNDVPLCTIYGDNRVVYASEIEGSSSFNVIWDTLTDQQISEFIGDLVVNKRIFTYDEGFTREVPSETMPVYERLVLNVNDSNHVTDSFADWVDNSAGDIELAYFEGILNDCRNLATSPKLFEPTGAWLSVETTELDNNQPAILWEAEAAGLSFNEIIGNEAPVWIEGANVLILWEQLYNTAFSLQIAEGEDSYYLFALQVPGVTVDSPPAPSQ